MQYTLTIL